MKIDKREYLQVGYKPELFESVHWDETKPLRKTAVDPHPQVNKHWDKTNGYNQQHHIFVEDFLEFASYIPNKYDVIHFTREATDYEIIKAKKLLSNGGEIILEKVS